MRLANETHRVTKTFSQHEQFELARQMRRAATSVASNISEGAGRGSDRDFRRFLVIAYGSACELETQARIAKEQKLGGEAVDTMIDLCDRVRGLLSGLIARLGSNLGP